MTWYLCNDCNHEFSDDDHHCPTQCPDCGSGDIDQEVSKPVKKPSFQKQYMENFPQFSGNYGQ
jgi:DNA-directed RNA polymerase subunit RPC12/RpoP